MSAPGPDALVLIHGFTGGPASWDEVVARWSRGGADRGQPLLRLTLCGHGPAALDGAEDFTGEVDRLARELRGHGLGGGARAHLCGYSLGARVGLGLLARHPTLVSGATLVGVHPGLTDEGERAARVESDERWARLAEEQGIAAFVAAWERQQVLAPALPADDARLVRQRALRLAHRPEGMARALRVLSLGRMPDLHRVLLDPPVPVTLVVGAADGKFRALAEPLAAANPRLGLRVVEGAAHNVPLEQPAAVAAALPEHTPKESPQ